MAIAAGVSYSLFRDNELRVWTIGNDIRTPTIVENLPPIVSVSAASHSLFLDSEGSVWGSGDNSYGQLGLGHKENVQTPTKIENLPPISSILSASGFSFFLDVQGNVWKCGYTSKKEPVHTTPQQVSEIKDIKQISGTSMHRLFLDTSGRCWGEGGSQNGELGKIIIGGTSSHIQIENLPAIKQVDNGTQHSLFLDEEGFVWGCGWNIYGELGVGHTNLVETPTLINREIGPFKSLSAGKLHSTFLDHMGKVWACGLTNIGQQYEVPYVLNELPNIICIKNGSSDSFFIDETFQVWGCGQNDGNRIDGSDSIYITKPKIILNVPVPDEINLTNQSKSARMLQTGCKPTSNGEEKQQEVKGNQRGNCAIF